MSNRRTRRFGLSIVLPILIACAGAIGLAADLITSVSNGANIADHDRTREVAQSAIASSVEQLANTIADNANWDDAALNLYAKDIDQAFAASAWGGPSETGVNYDVVIAVDGNGQVLTAYHAGKSFSPDVELYFKGGLKGLIARLPSDALEFKTAASVLATAEGPAIVAAGNLVPTTTGLVPADTPGRYLVFAKFLTPEFIAEIGQTFVIEDFHTEPSAARAFFTVTDIFGNPVMHLAWTDRRPGDLSNRAISPKAWSIILYLIVVMLAIAWLCYHEVRQVEERQTQSHYQATHDGLSGLPNRMRLMQYLEETSSDTKRGDGGLTITFVDLDGFKSVNDTYGHETGDRLIAAVSAGFAALAGPAALLARLGGDEFAVVHRGSRAAEDARALAQRIIQFLAEPFNLDGRAISVGASIGIADCPAEAIEVCEILRRADVAMYQAKLAGHGGAAVYSPEMDGNHLGRRALAADLKADLAAGRLRLAYQPIVDAKSHRACAVEALIRWDRAGHGPVRPDLVVTVAEQFGLIDELGTFVLATACRAARQWPEIRLAVNISPAQFRNPAFVATVASVLQETGFTARRLELEVTETHLIDQPQRVRQSMDRIRALGVSIALDDFGSGHSSVANLRQFQFDRLKVDRSLVAGITADLGGQTLLQATILLANSFDLRVTAEGVETEEQAILLNLAGCDLLQGYYFSQAIDAAAAHALFATAPETAAA
ncbi:MAG: EAL domain-containing protein [Rhizobiales bacterium]|nr:EAL domain-containing protein [Hyphomicrobiales bacterium]MBI3673481.1 EAL domain-containing protein [Hyphomicrobiales bacterium]